MIEGLVSYISKIKSFNRQAKLFLITVFVIHFLNGGYQVVFNLYLNSLGYKSDFIGTVDSVRLITGALLGIPFGILATKIGYKKSLLIVGVTIPVSILGLANSFSKSYLLFFSILWGIAFVLRGIVNAPFLAHYSKAEERSHLFGFTFSLQMWASMLGSFLGGSFTSTLQKFVDMQSSYRYTLYLYALFSLFALIPILFLRVDNIKQKNRVNILSNIVKISKNNDVKSFVLYSILIGTGAGLIVPLFNIFLRLRLNASDFQIGTLIGVTQIATSLGCLSTPYLVKAFGQYRSVVISQLVSVPFLIVVGGVNYFPIVAVAYFIRSSLMNMVNPIVESVSMQVVKEEDRAAASSLIRTFRSFGRGMGVYLSGLLLSTGNYLVPFVLTCFLYLSGSLVFYFNFSFRHNLLKNKIDASNAAK